MPDDDLKRTLNALRELMAMFQIERILYLLTAFVSFLLFIYAGWRLVSTGTPNQTDMVALFGASGLSAASSARVSYFLNKAFGLIEYLIRKPGAGV